MSTSFSVHLCDHLQGQSRGCCQVTEPPLGIENNRVHVDIQRREVMWGADMVGEFLGKELHHLALNKSKIQVGVRIVTFATIFDSNVG